MEEISISPLDLIKSERSRLEEIGISEESIFSFDEDELVFTAISYCSPVDLTSVIYTDTEKNNIQYEKIYPFDNLNFFEKKKDSMNRLQQLAVSGALILAEMERIIKNGIEIDLEIDSKTGEILFSRNNVDVLAAVKALNPDDFGTLECFIENKPKTIDGERNYKSFCG